jgi:hypothetical protein
MSSSAKASSPPLPRSPTLNVAGVAEPGRIAGFGRLFNKPPRSTVVGIVCAALVLPLCAASIEIPLLSQAQLSPAFKYVTGTLLLAWILLQWKLFDHREEDERPLLMATWYRRHKVLGATAPMIFFAHTATLGHAATFVLALSFFIVLGSGLFNRDLLNIQSRLLWQAWTVLHVGTAFAMCALIALHLWTAISFHR